MKLSIRNIGLIVAAVSVAKAAQAPKYTGPGSCSSLTCHGSVQPRTENSVFQNEYSTWTVHDKHSRTASVLTNDTSKRIGRTLGIQPETSNKCLDCHALNAAESERARSFETGDGVSCETCHGPASEWLGPHTKRDWTHEQSVQAGMTDLRDPIKRNETCLSCHLGSQSKWVDHSMIAAGHPDLYFEMASFSAAMPPHWKERDQDAWFDVRLLAVGQALQLRENMRQIARETARFWPEYSELECFACHHIPAGAKGNWRQEGGYPGRRPGNPAWNASRYTVLKLIVDETDAADAGRLEHALGRVSSLVSDVTADRQQIAAAAAQAAELADQVAHKASSYGWDLQSAVRLMEHIADSAEWISRQGERSAEQATMVLNSLARRYQVIAKPEHAVETRMNGAISTLFQMLENPPAYTPQAFAGQMHAFRKLLPGR